MSAPLPKAVSRPDWADGVDWDVSGIDLWRQTAGADYRLCRAFARVFEARLSRSLRCQRVGWETENGPAFALVLPNSQFMSYVRDDEWSFYYVEGATVFHRTSGERARVEMLLLPDGADDWAALLGQALRKDVCATRYEITPHHINSLGEMDSEPMGYVFALEACIPPQAVSVLPLALTGTGSTPEEAARTACLHWLDKQLPDTDFSKG